MNTCNRPLSSKIPKTGQQLINGMRSPLYHLDYHPNPTQQLFDHAVEQAIRRGQGMVAYTSGQGGGKTFAGAVKFLRLAACNQGRLGLLVSPTYSLAESPGGPLATVRELLDQADPPLRHTYIQSTHSLYIPAFKVTIKVMSASLPELISGLTAAFAWCDEPGIFRSSALPRVLARVRDADAPCAVVIMTGTPEGLHNDFHRLCVAKAPRELVLVQGCTADNREHLAKGYVEQLEAAYEGPQKDSYVMGRFVSLTEGRVYPAFDRAVHVGPVAFDPKAPVMLSCDFNINPMAWCLYQEQEGDLVVPPAGVLCLRHSDSFMASAAAAQRLRDLGWQGGDLLVYGDASGRHGSTNSRVSDYQVMEGEMRRCLGDLAAKVRIRLLAPVKNPPLFDSINAVNAFLRRRESPCLKVDPQGNEPLMQDMEQTCFSPDGQGIDKKDSQVSHFSDQLRYLVTSRLPLPRAVARSRYY